MTIDAVLFDLDGTLIDSASTIASVINGMRAEHRFEPLPVSSFRGWVSLGAEELLRRSMGRADDDVSIDVKEFRSRYRVLPTPPESLFPSVLETIAALAQASIAMAVCSNKPESLCRKILDEMDLSRHFSAIVGGDTADRPKPAREPLDLALHKMGHKAASAIFVGDSTVDQRAAEACGIRFVFFASGYDDGVNVSNAFARIHDIAEVKDFVLGATSGAFVTEAGSAREFRNERVVR